MIPTAVFTGFLTAVVVTFPRIIRGTAPAFPWGSAWWLLIPGALATWLAFRRRLQPYCGLSDLFAHVLRPNQADSGGRWGMHALLSFLLSIFGGTAGPEGAAIEASQAFSVQRRTRSQRWSEQVRRTDASAALAAAVSAAFGAPFAGFLLVAELGMGGRTLLAGLAAISAFITQRFVLGVLPFEVFDLSGALYGFHFNQWRQWVGAGVVALIAGAAAAGLIRLALFARENLIEQGRDREWLRLAIGSAILVGIGLVAREGHAPMAGLLELSLWSRKPAGEVLLILAAQVLGLVAVLSSIGTLGVFWQVFGIGGLLGYLLHIPLASAIPGWGAGLSGDAAAFGMIGGAALWGAFFGAPFAGAVLVFELTQNFHVLLPCLLAAFLAQRLRRALRTETFHEEDLRRRGMGVAAGRIEAILDSITVAQAMVTDHETALESDPVSTLHSQLLRGRYPFLPILGAQGGYLGMLSVDLIEDAWKAEDPLASHSPLARLIEAKDLLYRAGQRTPSVRPEERLTKVMGRFEEYPCLPVVGADGKVVGLLFVQNVRLAYDREVARSALVPGDLKA